MSNTRAAKRRVAKVKRTEWMMALRKKYPNVTRKMVRAGAPSVSTFQHNKVVTEAK